MEVSSRMKDKIESMLEFHHSNKHSNFINFGLKEFTNLRYLYAQFKLKNLFENLLNAYTPISEIPLNLSSSPACTNNQ